MEPEKFENKIKQLLEEREIQPASHSWDRLEQRLEHQKRGLKLYFYWVSTVAAAVILFVVIGSYFNTPIASENPGIVEEIPEMPILKEKISEPEVLQVAASEVEETKEKPSEEKAVKNAIFETSVPKVASEAITATPEAATKSSETFEEEYPGLVREIKAQLASREMSREVTDTEIETLLLLAAAELEPNPAFALNADDLLHQVEYELEQSFRQKVFEVVKEGLLKAKTAVANRDF